MPAISYCVRALSFPVQTCLAEMIKFEQIKTYKLQCFSVCAAGAFIPYPVLIKMTNSCKVKCACTLSPHGDLETSNHNVQSL